MSVSSAPWGNTEFAAHGAHLTMAIIEIAVIKPHTSARTDALSLQDKLDHIAHERDVLALLRDLARSGLNDGDAVRHRTTGASGHVVVLRSERVPHPVVQLDDGSEVPFEAESWGPIAG